MVRKLKEEEFNILVKKYMDQGYSEKISKGIVRSRLKNIIISKSLIDRPPHPFISYVVQN